MKVPEPRKMSSGNYYIQLRLNGVSIPVTAPTAAECKRQAALIKAEHKAGRRAVRSLTDITLAEGIEEYIASQTNVISETTIRGYESIKRNRFPSVMHKPLNRVQNWQAVINNEAKNFSAKTVENGWSLVASVMKMYDMPVPKVRLPQVVNNEKEWLTPEQIPIFIEAVKDKSWAVAALLGLHSLRRSEIYGVAQTNGIDLKNNVIHVRGACVYNSENKFIYKKTNKNKSSARDVPIMIPLLSDLLKSGAEITPCAPNTLRRQINKVCEENGLPQVGIHGLRHSFASLAYHLGWSEKDTMTIGGWSDANTMRKIYTHLSELDKQKRANAMTEFYKNANKNAN